MPYEPVEHLKAHIPKTRDEIGSKFETFLKTSQQDLNLKFVEMEKNWNKLLKNEAHTSAILFRDNEVLVKKLASQVNLNSTFLLPYGVLLPIIATSLPILLEGYQPKLINEPLGSVLKEKHRTHRDVRNYLAFSLVEIVTKLPHERNSVVDFSDPELFPELERRGKAALYFVNAVLGDVAGEAWEDCMMSVSMDNSVFNENKQMMTNFVELNHYAETIANDLINFYEVSKSDAYSLDAGHYLFGWWFSHPRDSESDAIIPLLPSDTVAILSPAIRVYSVPSVRLNLIVSNTGQISQKHTLSEIIQHDQQIWNQMYSVVDPAFSQVPVKDEKNTKEAELKEEVVSEKDGHEEGDDNSKHEKTEEPNIISSTETSIEEEKNTKEAENEQKDEILSEKASKDGHTFLEEGDNDSKQEKHEKTEEPQSSTETSAEEEKNTKAPSTKEAENEQADEVVSEKASHTSLEEGDDDSKQEKTEEPNIIQPTTETSTEDEKNTKEAENEQADEVVSEKTNHISLEEGDDDSKQEKAEEPSIIQSSTETNMKDEENTKEAENEQKDEVVSEKASHISLEEGDDDSKQEKAEEPIIIQSSTSTSAEEEKHTKAPSTKEDENEQEDEVVSEKASKDGHKEGDDSRREKHKKIEATKSVPTDEEEDEVIEEKPPMKGKPSKMTLPNSEWNTVQDDVLGEKNEEESLTPGIYFVIHYGWPITVFLFYTILSHVWVYWIVHLAWFVATLFSSSVHLPRPKTAKQD